MPTSPPSPWFVHNLDPIAFTVGGESVPWYWLNYLLGFLWCWVWLQHLALKGNGRNSAADVASFASWGWIGMLLGARLGYILLYNLNWYRSNPDQIFAVWNGGMSFHGGLIGIALSSWLVAMIRRVDLLAFTDMLATVISWPLAVGRVCNFINGELPGRPTSVPWAVIFPDPWNDFPRHPSQLYEAASEGILLGLLMIWAWKRLGAQRGVVSAVFLAAYGALRFFTEFTREPDPQVGYILDRFTLGQVLCLVMIGGAAWLLHRIGRKSQGSV